MQIEKKNGLRNKERKIKQLLNVNDLFKDEIKFPTCYVLTFPGLDIEAKLNVIAADAEIKSKIGQVHIISKLNNLQECTTDTNSS